MVVKTKPRFLLLRHFSEWTGLIYLSAFVFNTGLLWFFVRRAIACSFIDAGPVIFVECGPDALGQFLNVFLLFFSPLIAPVSVLYGRYLFYFPETLSDVQIKLLISFFVVLAFVSISCLLALRKMIRGFVLRKRFPERVRRSWLMLAVIFLPAFLSFGYRLYLMPPEWVNRQIQVDVWNGVFEVPRADLKDWSISNRAKPDRKPNEYASKMRWWRSVPFLTFYYSPDSEAEPIEVTVIPHYERLDKAEIYMERNRLASYRTGLKSEDTGEAIYPSSPRLEGKWEIYEGISLREDIFSDVYIAKDPGGNIETILQCTPKNACATKIRGRWTEYPCTGKLDCGACHRICTDYSMGTSSYDIQYSFDKKRVGEYDQLNINIRNFIASFYTPKNKDISP